MHEMDLTVEEYTDVIDLLQDMVEDEVDNPDVQAWVPIINKLRKCRYFQRKLNEWDDAAVR